MKNPATYPQLALLLGVLLLSSPAPALADADAARARLLVDPAWLAAHLHDPDLVVLHVGDEEDFAKEHVEGARHIDLDLLSAPREGDDPLGLQLPTAEAVADSLEGLGISDDSRIVVMFGRNWVTPTTRVIFTLDWIGLGARTSLLDGGLTRWKAEGHPVTDLVVAPERGSITPRPRADLVVDAAWVDEHRDDPGICLVDARAKIHYEGVEATQRNGHEVRRGHIPDAGNLPFTQIVDDDLRLRSPDELRALFAEAGYEDGDTVVGYCHLGLFATLVIYAARTLDLPVRLYDGSFQEWGSIDSLPVVNEAAGR